MKTNFGHLLCALLLLGSVTGRASDGFDNNFISFHAHELLVEFLPGYEQDVLFGPSNQSVGSYFINLSNGTTFNAGVVTHFKLKEVKTHPRSAYFDRVLTSTLYYRIYATNDPNPPGYSEVSLSHTPLSESTCHTVSQQDNWSYNFNFMDVLAGLSNTTYFFEYYLESTLHDVGDESTPCNINAELQCDNNIEHPGRILTSRFPNTVVDPTVCSSGPNYYYTLTLANPSKIQFQVTNAAPLTWSAFQASKKMDSVVLNWATEQEKNVERFDVQRSTDGFRWVSIHEQSATGYSDSRSEYTFTDDHPVRGLDYYRLRAMDFDGTVNISSTVAVRFGDGLAQAQIFPSPATSSVSFRLSAEIRESAASVVVIDWAGQVLRTFPLSGQGEMPVPVDDLMAGLYFVEFRSEDGQRLATGKFVKE